MTYSKRWADAMYNLQGLHEIYAFIYQSSLTGIVKTASTLGA